jgi:glycosyltransferase involved in cell wall biosynthesis
MNRTPSVTVVLSTYNRCGQLPSALDALQSQRDGVPYEIIVVDNNSSDGTRELLLERMEQFPELSYLFEPRQGLPYARNTGARAARAPIVAFTDDDVRVGPEWVATVARAFEAHPDVDMIGGRVLPVWPDELPDWLTRRQLGPLALGEHGDRPMRVSAENAAPCLVGANFAFRRRVFDRIGYFDESYTKSQDREIQLRLWRAGGVGLYVPELSIAVEVPRERLTKQYFRYWYTTYGMYHSRMGLLDDIDREGRLRPVASRRLGGVPLFLYRELTTSAGAWLAALARLDRVAAFYWENRSRYLFHYLRERYRHPRHPPAARRAAA